MEPGTEFRCPHCKEWFRVEEMLDSEKPPNLTKEQAERLGTIKLVHLDKEEVEGLKGNADTGEWEN
jgi:hypothetical protein